MGRALHLMADWRIGRGAAAGHYSTNSPLIVTLSAIIRSLMAIAPDAVARSYSNRRDLGFQGRSALRD